MSHSPCGHTFTPSRGPWSSRRAALVRRQPTAATRAFAHACGDTHSVLVAICDNFWRCRTLVRPDRNAYVQVKGQFLVGLTGFEPATTDPQEAAVTRRRRS